MNRISIIALVLILISQIGLLNAQDTLAKRGPRITFDEKVKDYGDIYYGDSISYTFKFTNTGNENLIISAVKTTCVCTSVKFNEEPIGPGQSGELKVVFNSSKQEGMGRQRKTISVISNALNNYEQAVLICTILLKRSH